MASISKAAILARGLGRRMRAVDESSSLDAAQSSVADRGIKAMIPVGRPFLDYVLCALAGAGFPDVCLVIGPEHEEIRDYYRRLAPRRLHIHFALQLEPRGTADAVLACESFAGGDQFLVLNSDNYYPVDCLRALHDMDGPGLAVFTAGSLLREGNISEERLRAFAVLDIDEDGWLRDIVEKPGATHPITATSQISMNLWRFDSAIFDACRAVPLSERGEYELPRAVREGLRAGGLRMRAVPCHAGVLDLSRRSDIESVAARLRGVPVAL